MLSGRSTALCCTAKTVAAAHYCDAAHHQYGSNVLLGSVWKAMLYGKGYLYYFTSGLVKNTTMLPSRCS